MNITDAYKQNEFVSTIFGILKSDADLKTKDDENFIYEIYADRYDTLPDKTIADICESGTSGLDLDTLMWDMYGEYSLNLLDGIEKFIREQLESDYPDGLTEDQEKILIDILNENICFKFPYDHYLQQKVHAVIFVDTGDGNYDFSLNHRYPAWGGDYEDEIDPKASIRWLAETQGFTEPELRHALEDDDTEMPHGFLKSMRDELANFTASLPCLTFLAEMTVADLIALNSKIQNAETDNNGEIIYDVSMRPDVGDIWINKCVKAGLYDDWYGSGGLFEIQLEKDVKLPIKYIHSALPDGGIGRYSIQQVYGKLGHEYWQSAVSFV